MEIEFGPNGCLIVANERIHRVSDFGDGLVASAVCRMAVRLQEYGYPTLGHRKGLPMTLKPEIASRLGLAASPTGNGLNTLGGSDFAGCSENRCRSAGGQPISRMRVGLWTNAHDYENLGKIYHFWQPVQS